MPMEVPYFLSGPVSIVIVVFYNYEILKFQGPNHLGSSILAYSKLHWAGGPSLAGYQE